MEQVRMAIRDSTDSYNVGFFDNKAGIKYDKADLTRFLTGSASVLTLKYFSKDIDTIRSGCKLAFRYRGHDFWLNIMDFQKTGFSVELTAYSLGLELNQEKRGAHKPDRALSFAEYLAYYDPEHALTLGVNEVADKRIKLEWTGTDTILARLFSIANSFEAELEFVTILNEDYSLKQHTVNVYRKGNMGKDSTGTPVRVGKDLQVIDYADNIKELRTAVRATGKDGLTIDGLDKKVYDDEKKLLYYSSGMTVYAPQSRDRFPSVGKNSDDNWIVKELGETEYESKEALYGYMLSELKKVCVPKVTYKTTGSVEGDVGDTKTLIDNIHYKPTLYVQARISEQTRSLITGKATETTLTNFERKYGQVSNELLKRVEELAQDAAPYVIRFTSTGGTSFKNSKGSSTLTATLKKGDKTLTANWQWLVNNALISERSSVTINANQVNGALMVVAVALIDGKEVARDWLTFTNTDDGVGVRSVKPYYATTDQSNGVTTGNTNWSGTAQAMSADKKYLWFYQVTAFTNDTSTVTEPIMIGARGEDGADADTDAINQAIEESRQRVTQLANDLITAKTSLERSAEEAKANLATVAQNLDTAKTALNQSISEVNGKVTAAQADIKQTKADVTSQAAKLTEQGNRLAAQATQLEAQAQAQTALTSRVTTVETTANGTKQTVSDLTKTVDAQTQKLTTATQKTASLETGLNGLEAKLTQTTTDLNAVKNQSNQTATDLASKVKTLTQKDADLKLSIDGLLTSMSETRAVLDTATGNITSLTNKTNTLEVTVNGTKQNLSALSQTMNSVTGDVTSISKRTATLESNLNGVEEKFANLSVGFTNLILNSNDFANPHKQTGAKTLVGAQDGYFFIKSTGYTENAWGGLTWKLSLSEVKDGEQFSLLMPVYIDSSVGLDGAFRVQLKNHSKNQSAYVYTIPSDQKNGWVDVAITFTTNELAFDSYPFYVYLEKNGFVRLKPPILVRGAVKPKEWHAAEEDTSYQIAEYKRTAEQNAATLQAKLQTLDGTVAQNKSSIEQTANGLKTRIESLETYKNAEGTRATQYFEAAKSETAKQISAERTQVSENYVAKSAYTADAKSISQRFEATETVANTAKTNAATAQTSANAANAAASKAQSTADGATTKANAAQSTADTVKSNLATYQLSNDKALLALQQSLKTTDGNVSNLKTNLEAVPGKIQTAVEAVEGKIPTSVGGRNYIRQYGLTATGWTFNKAGWKFEIIADSTAKSGQCLKATCTTASTTGGGFYKLLLDFSDGRFFGNVMTWAMDIKLSKAKSIKIGPEWGRAYLDINATTQWQRYSNTFTVATTTQYKEWIVYTNDNVWDVGDVVYLRDVQLEDGKLATTPSPAPEDAVQEVSNLKTSITQTQEKIETLATKTSLDNVSGRLSTAETKITTQAGEIEKRLTSTQVESAITAKGYQTKTQVDNNIMGRGYQTGSQVESTITGKGYQTKSQVDSNITGRGYITENSVNNKLSSYVTTTVLDNKVSETVDGYTREISRVEGLVSTETSGNILLASNVGVKEVHSSFLTLAEPIVKGKTYTVVQHWWRSGAKPSKGVPNYCIDGNMSADGSTQYVNLKFDSTIDSWIATFTSTVNVAKGTKIRFANSDYKNGSFGSSYDSTGSWAFTTLVAGKTPLSSWQPHWSEQATVTALNAVKSTADEHTRTLTSLQDDTLKKAEVSITSDKIVLGVGKEINGRTFSTMIAQNESDVQILAKKMKVTGDMIVNGAITAEKLNINGALSALSAKLGDVTSGSITNNFTDATRSGTIQIRNDIRIDSKDTSPTTADKANQHIRMTSGGFSLSAEDVNNKPAYLMNVNPEAISFQKLNYDTSRGGTSGWTLSHNGYYSMLQVDMVWQNVRLSNVSNLMYGVSANYVRIGNLITISVNRQIKTINEVVEYKKADETIPTGFRPISQAHLTLVGNTGTTIDATCIVHLNPDGSIYFTNNKVGNRVWTGTVTYTCIEPMPYVKNLNNGSIL